MKISKPDSLKKGLILVQEAGKSIYLIELNIRKSWWYLFHKLVKSLVYNMVQNLPTLNIALKVV